MIAFLILLFPLYASAQAVRSTTPPNGIRQHNVNIIALTHAQVVTEPGRRLDDATIVMRNGRIVEVASRLAPPLDATVHDLSGKTVYAGFVDAFFKTGAKLPENESGDGLYWNQYIRPERVAADYYAPDSAALADARSQGFCALAVAPPASVISGTSTLIAAEDLPPDQVIIRESAALTADMSFPRSREHQGGYPESPMGAMTLIRQTYLDQEWYSACQTARTSDSKLPNIEYNRSLQALAELRNAKIPVVLNSPTEAYCIRSGMIAKEFDLNGVILGSGREYRRLELVAQTGLPVICPLNFPKPPKVDTPEDVREVTLEELLEWDNAPENPARLAGAGVKLCLTMSGLKTRDEFLKRLRLAVAKGLNADAALASLTTTPAALLGAENEVGKIAPGFRANLIVAEGDLFESDADVLSVYVNAHEYVTEESPFADLRGTWKLVSGPDSGSTLLLSGEDDELEGRLITASDTTELKQLDLSDHALTFQRRDSASVTFYTALASVDSLSGFGDRASESFQWRAIRVAIDSSDSDDEDELPDTARASFPMTYPLMAYAYEQMPPVENLLAVTNATIWTCDDQGILENATLLIRDGAIEAVGDVKIPAGARVLDATGKHVTPGIIDAHAHFACEFGSNESGQAISAEVHLGDFIDANEIDFYRQLAGGTTAALILHGSANTIGGKSQVVRHRWGAGPQELKEDRAISCIKFALGENPRQSNWYSPTSRYPKTRMGVEQLIRDEFTAAREYKKAHQDYARTKKGLPPRRDLELETIVEILDRKRFIHCHSYRQDEIIALMRICEEFGIRVHTLQHILEGYKIADEIKKHGAHCSCFADWWTYKFEVYDAIPYAGSVMQQQGIVTTFNSDDSEYGRRMNYEAAKAIKYGGLSPQEALKMVTINGAIQTGMDSFTGSLTQGKDADFVIWSSPPMSTFTKCERTFVEGREMFSLEKDAELRENTRMMRATLINKILLSGQEMKPRGEHDAQHEEDENCCFGHGVEGHR